jgi:hypothetical protein
MSQGKSRKPHAPADIPLCVLPENASQYIRYRAPRWSSSRSKEMTGAVANVVFPTVDQRADLESPTSTLLRHG